MIIKIKIIGKMIKRLMKIFSKRFVSSARLPSKNVNVLKISYEEGSK